MNIDGEKNIAVESWTEFEGNLNNICTQNLN